MGYPYGSDGEVAEVDDGFGAGLFAGTISGCFFAFPLPPAILAASACSRRFAALTHSLFTFAPLTIFVANR